MGKIGQESLHLCTGSRESRLVKRVCDSGCDWLRESAGMGRSGQDSLWK